MLWRDAYNQLRYSHHAAFFQFFRIHLDCKTTWANKLPGTEQKFLILWLTKSPGSPTGHQFSIGWFLSFTSIHSIGVKIIIQKDTFYPPIFVVNSLPCRLRQCPREIASCPPLAEETFWPTLRHGCPTHQLYGDCFKESPCQSVFHGSVPFRTNIALQ